MFFHLNQMRMDEDQAKFFFIEIVLCMEYLHKQKILYRDLKVCFFYIKFYINFEILKFFRETSQEVI